MALLPQSPAPASYAAPLLDFSPISRLGDRFFEGAQQRRQYDLQNAFRGGLPMLPGTNIPDIGAMAQTLARLGGVDQAVQLAGQAQGQEANRAATNFLLSPGQPGAPSPAGTPSSAPAAAGGREPRGIRNANPGNIEDGRFAQSQPGYAGSDGRFARFATMEDGIRAAGNLLGAYGKRGLNTIQEVIARWAPQSDGNNVSAYAATVANALGISPTDPVNLADPDTRQKIAAAMFKVETGRTVPMGGQQTESLPAPPPIPVSSTGAPPDPVAEGQPGYRPWPPLAQAAGARMTDAGPGTGTMAATAQAAPVPSPSATGGAPAADPTLGGLVPKGWQPQQYLDALDARAAMPGISQNARETILARAKSIRDALSKKYELTPDIKEYQRAKSEGYAGTFEQWQIRMKEAGRSQLNIDQRQESEYEKAMGKQFADLNKELIQSGQTARGKINTLDRMGQLLKNPNVYTGTAANLVADLKKMAKSAGLDVEGLPDTEAVRSIANQFALELRNPSGGAGMPGAMSDKDREFLVASVPGLTQTREGNLQIIDYMKRIAQRSLDVERLRQSYVRDHKRLDEGFYRTLSDFSDKNPIFPEADKQGASPGAMQEFANPGAMMDALNKGLIKSGEQFRTTDGRVFVVP